MQEELWRTHPKDDESGDGFDVKGLRDVPLILCLDLE